MRSMRTLAAIALVISLGACSEREPSGLAGPGMTKPHFYGGGESGRSGAPGAGLCSDCHDRPNGTAPTVTLSGPSSLNSGETGDYTLTIEPASGSDQTQGGLNVAVPDGGTLIAGSGTSISGGEIVQSSEQRGSGTLSWSFQWQAPSSGGSFNMYGVGLYCMTLVRWQFLMQSCRKRPRFRMLNGKSFSTTLDMQRNSCGRLRIYVRQ